ncbi:hypothetical protein CC80DRAFT_595039 [Byssothecium circinans]|uniref:HNH nuclease domain-containing protein n=1 Tax=Byssothecium circinans TaxID=147558 RepID=A0A6A5TVA8_9PLEO|nr:hypothetical protein CC80DRAFT_595039 [Byssothecium circinans]
MARTVDQPLRWMICLPVFALWDAAVHETDLTSAGWCGAISTAHLLPFAAQGPLDMIPRACSSKKMRLMITHTTAWTRSVEADMWALLRRRLIAVQVSPTDDKIFRIAANDSAHVNLGRILANGKFRSRSSN